MLKGYKFPIINLKPSAFLASTGAIRPCFWAINSCKAELKHQFQPIPR
jgi:hypothetical protein